VIPSEVTTALKAVTSAFGGTGAEGAGDMSQLTAPFSAAKQAAAGGQAAAEEARPASELPAQPGPAEITADQPPPLPAANQGLTGKALTTLALPDTALPEQALPDTALPDTALPDTALPDTALPDQPVEPIPASLVPPRSLNGTAPSDKEG
jgi:hypothetical protein